MRQATYTVQINNNYKKKERVQGIDEFFKKRPSLSESQTVEMIQCQ